MRLNPINKATQEERARILTEAPIPSLITTLAVPTIISMLVTALYNMADTFFVGKISTEATAAVGLVFSVMAIIQALGFLAGHGSGNYMSRRLGAGDRREAEVMASTGFTAGILIGIVVAAAGIRNITSLSLFLGATPTTLADTQAYMSVILLGAPVIIGSFVLNNQLRFQGSASYAMIGLMSGAVINVALDPLLIFGFDMGVAGAAWATIIGQAVSLLVLFVMTQTGNCIHLSVTCIRLTPHFIGQMLNGGMPSLARQGMAAVATLLLNRYAGVYGGDAAIAGMSVVSRVMLMSGSALIGFGQGFQPVCSFNYGAGRKTRVREGYFFCLRYGTVFMTTVGILCFVFAPQIVGYFRSDPAVIEVGSAALRWQAAVLPLSATIIMTNMLLQSIGRGVKGSVMAACRNGLCFIPLLIILSTVRGLFGVEIAQSCADVLSFVIAIPMASSELSKMKKEALPVQADV